MPLPDEATQKQDSIDMLTVLAEAGDQEAYLRLLRLKALDLTTVHELGSTIEKLQDHNTFSIETNRAKDDSILRLALDSNDAILYIAKFFFETKDFDTAKLLTLCATDFSLNLFKQEFGHESNPLETLKHMVHLAAMVLHENQQSECLFDFFNYLQCNESIQALLDRGRKSHEAFAQFMNTPIVDLKSGEFGTFNGCMIGDLLNFKALKVTITDHDLLFDWLPMMIEKVIPQEATTTAEKNSPPLVAWYFNQLPALTRIVAEEGVEATIRAIEVVQSSKALCAEENIVMTILETASVEKEIRNAAQEPPLYIMPQNSKFLLPNLRNSKIDPKKLTEYALNHKHPIWGYKARVLESILGYNKAHAKILIDELYEKLPQSKIILGKLDQYGQRYTVDMSIAGLNGNTAIVRTGWILKIGSTTPELTTLYIK